MNVVDSCGWLEYFAGGPNADFFAPLLEAKDGTLLMPTLCLYEVFKNILVQFGREEAVEKVAVMRQETVIPLDDSLALDAALLSHELRIPMADSIILATARCYNAVLWTQDIHFQHITGVRYCPKVSS
ncbi:MAG TPA: type II toxin-antitoxin system VapC family toxin [Candidatus Hydrogenedentes bacterium]|nr:type II toxin-antitoxin system VapC family toxin [Candidatus Hydrogenedentota bacterium]